jgi:hypothetical protein
LRQIRNPQRALITRLTELVKSDQNSTGHLPWPLRRIFTAEYCESLQQTLDVVRCITLVESISCRIRYPGDDGYDRIWRLADTGSEALSEAYDFAPGKNVHSYVCDDGDGKGCGMDGPGANGELPKRVFLPDVKKEEFNRKLYPGLRYQQASRKTETELCFGLPIHGREAYKVCFNVESQSFIDLWMLEEFFRQMATILAAEVAFHYRRMEAANRSASEIGAMFVRSLNHNMTRAFDREAATAGQGEMLKRVRRPVDLELQLSRMMNDLELKPLDWALKQGVELFKKQGGISEEADIELILPADGAADDVPGRAKVLAAFPLLLTKLLIEQADTLSRLNANKEQGSSNMKVEFLVTRRVSQDRRHVIIDIFNNIEPDKLETRRHAEAMFWYIIDDDSREAPGRSGQGLYLLGHMLRMIDCRPCMRGQPVQTALKAYNYKLQNRISKQMRGLSIELYFPLHRVT